VSETKLKFLNGVQFIALFEATKGVLVFVAGFGLLALIHRDLQALAENVVDHLHLNPASHFSQAFIEWASNVTDAKLRLFATIAIVYASVRFIEAYGLWRLRTWAEWFAIISGSIYLPIEVYEIFQKPTIFRFALFLVNALIVAYLIRVRLNKKINGAVNS
jgi:uncharacterized membrane protein (DUF2068 family)